MYTMFLVTFFLYFNHIPIDDDEREKLVHSIKYYIIVVTAKISKAKTKQKPTKQVNDAIQKDLYYEL